MSKANDPRFYETRGSARPRARLDRIWTNPWMTQTLVRELSALHYDIPGPVWECAAGRGDMSRALKDCGHAVYSSDIDMSEFDNEIGSGHECSFLDEFQVPVFEEHDDDPDTPPQVGPCRSIITNPPYNEPWRGISNDFIRQGLGFFEQDVEFMAMLLRSEFRCGKSRKDMFGECPHYMGELVLTTRPRWDYGDPNAPEKAAPRHNFSWFLWSKEWCGRQDKLPIQIFSYMSRGFKP